MEVGRFNRGIPINEDIQCPYVLDEFQIGEVDDGFIVWCEGPSVVRTNGAGATSNTTAKPFSEPSRLAYEMES
jgi:hypothetical protein